MPREFTKQEAEYVAGFAYGYICRKAGVTPSTEELRAILDAAFQTIGVVSDFESEALEEIRRLTEEGP